MKRQSAPSSLAMSTPREPGPQVVRPVAVLLVASLLGCAEPMCATEVIRETPSPDGRLAAVEYHRDCGAATPLNTQVAIVTPGDKAMVRWRARP